jgi:hypothetical protein
VHGASDVLVAANDGRYSALAYRVPVAGGARRCRFALVDLAAATVEQPHTMCRADESVAALALEDSAAGPIACLGIDREPGRIDAADAADAADERDRLGNRLVALDSRSGTPLASTALRGRPAGLVLAGAWDRPGSRLYSVEAPAGERPSTPSLSAAAPLACRLRSVGRPAPPVPRGRRNPTAVGRSGSSEGDLAAEWRPTRPPDVPPHLPAPCPPLPPPAAPLASGSWNGPVAKLRSFHPPELVPRRGRRSGSGRNGYRAPMRTPARGRRVWSAPGAG